MINEKILNKKIISINKVCKSNKGFRCFSYSVLAIIGDNNGGIGFGKGNGKDQNSGSHKAISSAIINFFRVPLKNNTIYHGIIGKHGSSSVLLIPGRYGSGVSAGGSTRFVFEVMGVKSIICKIHGSSNPYNILRATINALMNLKSAFFVSKKRSKLLMNLI